MNPCKTPSREVLFDGDDMLSLAIDHVKETRDISGCRLRAITREGRGVRVLIIPCPAEEIEPRPVYGLDFVISGSGEGGKRP